MFTFFLDCSRDLKSEIKPIYSDFSGFMKRLKPFVSILDACKSLLAIFYMPLYASVLCALSLIEMFLKVVFLLSMFIKNLGSKQTSKKTDEENDTILEYVFYVLYDFVSIVGLFLACFFIFYMSFLNTVASTRFFAPRLTVEQMKLREAIDEYKRQVEFDTEECCLIKELLNEHLIKLERISNVLSELSKKYNDTSSTTSLPDANSSITDNASDEELEKKLYSLLNTYPYIDRVEDFHFDNLKQYTSARQEHHALVVSLAEVVLAELSIIEENGIRIFEKCRFDHLTSVIK